MFLSYTSTNRHLSSLTDGSRGVNSPSFGGTMKVLRLPSSISSPSVSLGLDTTSPLPFSYRPPSGNGGMSGLDLLVYRLSLIPVVTSGDVRLSQVPVDTSCMFALLSDPGRYVSASPYQRHYIAALTYQNSESSDNHKHFGAQSHSFHAPCLRFVPASQLTTQDSVLAAG